MGNAGTVIIGAGTAGATVALEARARGVEGPITLVNGEAGLLPYHRPPLSKAYLHGEAGPELLSMASATRYTEQGIDLIDNPVVGIDIQASKVFHADNTSRTYRNLVFATGSQALRLPIPGSNAQGVFTLRTSADADAIKDHLSQRRGHNILVVGAGFLGLEAAASFRHMGYNVTVSDVQQRALADVVSLATANAITGHHQRAGIRFHLGGALSRILVRDGAVFAAEWQGGLAAPVDMVLFAAGSAPRVQLAKASGLDVGRAIIVGKDLRARHNVYAVGDCAQPPTSCAPTVQSAVDQAHCVADNLAGNPTTYVDRPWAWSTQGPIRLQVAGIRTVGYRWVARGDVGSLEFSVFGYDAHGACRVVESVNQPRIHAAARRIVQEGLSLPRSAVQSAALADLPSLMHQASLPPCPSSAASLFESLAQPA